MELDVKTGWRKRFKPARRNRATVSGQVKLARHAARWAHNYEKRKRLRKVVHAQKTGFWAPPGTKPHYPF